MSKTKRLFLALNLPEDLREKIFVWVKQNLEGLPLRLVPPENLHLTLVFFGWTKRLEEILKILGEINFSAFSLEFQGVGTFPASRPRLFWIGIKENRALLDLQKKLSQQYESKGFALEKRGFSPHLTIARLKPISEIPPLIARNQEKYFGKTEVLTLDLMESRLKRCGPEYFLVQSFPCRSTCPPTCPPKHEVRRWKPQGSNEIKLRARIKNRGRFEL
ncbi:RNA 2',3'-cyclic phosphodiesterase [Candidatus Berkelbacteria bacterium]|nr:RNA 2',3'-cyclic phosphodiesterase [Candidatus Berkelbacteria bacterium]